MKENNQQSDHRKMLLLGKKQILLVLLCALALLWTHVNVLQLFMGNSKWVMYSINKMFAKEQLDFSINLYDIEEQDHDHEDITINSDHSSICEIKGHYAQDILSLAFYQDVFEFMVVTWDVELGQLSIDSAVGRFEDIEMSSLSMSDVDLSPLGINLPANDMTQLIKVLVSQLEVVCQKKHVVEGGDIVNRFMINNQFGVSIDYIGNIQKINGVIDLDSVSYYIDAIIY